MSNFTNVIDRLAPLVESSIGGGSCIIRKSTNGVPHAVYKVRGTQYSVCWFGGLRLYRVFYPYAKWGATQTRIDFKTLDEVEKFFDDEITKVREKKT